VPGVERVFGGGSGPYYTGPAAYDNCTDPMAARLPKVRAPAGAAAGIIWRRSRTASSASTVDPPNQRTRRRERHHPGHRRPTRQEGPTPTPHRDPATCGRHHR